MELNELKSLWKEENQKLENRLKLNEKLLQKMNLDKVVGEVDKLIKRSILGRNLALVYALISFTLSFLVLKEWAYSIPGLLGGFAMLWSFSYNSKIQKPDYYQLSVIDLQKTICDFRIHTAKTATSDIAIVGLWFLTYVPIIIKLILKVSIYSDFQYFAIFGLSALLFIGLLISASKKIYKEYESKLKLAEAQLDEIIEFEKM